MTNHPNRNWRARMLAACALYLDSWGWREGGARVMPDAELRDLVASAYRAGYSDGRTSKNTETVT